KSQREKSKFVKQFNVDPNVQSSREKYSDLRISENVIGSPPSRLRMRGASRSSRTLEAGCDGRDGVGRFSARRLTSSRTAKSCGPGLPTLRPSSQNALASSLRATGARKPGPRGERV